MLAVCAPSVTCRVPPALVAFIKLTEALESRPSPLKTT
jgi:hypothetical protein